MKLSLHPRLFFLSVGYEPIIHFLRLGYPSQVYINGLYSCFPWPTQISPNVSFQFASSLPKITLFIAANPPHQFLPVDPSSSSSLLPRVGSSSSPHSRTILFQWSVRQIQSDFHLIPSPNFVIRGSAGTTVQMILLYVSTGDRRRFAGSLTPDESFMPMWSGV